MVVSFNHKIIEFCISQKFEHKIELFGINDFGYKTKKAYPTYLSKGNDMKILMIRMKTIQFSNYINLQIIYV